MQELSHDVLLCVILKSTKKKRKKKNTGNNETIKQKVSLTLLSTFNLPRGVEHHPLLYGAAICERLPKRRPVPPQLWCHTAFNDLTAALDMRRSSCSVDDEKNEQKPVCSALVVVLYICLLEAQQLGVEGNKTGTFG